MPLQLCWNPPGNTIHYLWASQLEYIGNVTHLTVEKLNALTFLENGGGHQRGIRKN